MIDCWLKAAVFVYVVVVFMRVVEAERDGNGSDLKMGVFSSNMWVFSYMTSITWQLSMCYVLSCTSRSQQFWHQRVNKPTHFLSMLIKRVPIVLAVVDGLYDSSWNLMLNVVAHVRVAQTLLESTLLLLWTFCGQYFNRHLLIHFKLNKILMWNASLGFSNE